MLAFIRLSWAALLIETSSRYTHHGLKGSGGSHRASALHRVHSLPGGCTSPLPHSFSPRSSLAAVMFTFPLRIMFLTKLWKPKEGWKTTVLWSLQPGAHLLRISTHWRRCWQKIDALTRWAGEPCCGSIFVWSKHISAGHRCFGLPPCGTEEGQAKVRYHYYAPKEASIKVRGEEHSEICCLEKRWKLGVKS